MRPQAECFEEIRETGRRISTLAGIVQNDFELLVADGHVTRKELFDSTGEVRQAFDEQIDALMRLKEEVIQQLEDASK